MDAVKTRTWDVVAAELDMLIVAHVLSTQAVPVANKARHFFRMLSTDSMANWLKDREIG